MTSQLFERLSALEPYRVQGRVQRCRADLVICEGLAGLVALGDTCVVQRASHNQDGYPPPGVRRGDDVLAEVVGIDERRIHLLPAEAPTGIGAGGSVTRVAGYNAIRPDPAWLGRVIDPLARPLDGGPPLAWGPAAYPLAREAVPAYRRRGLGPRLDLGVRALNLFTPCREGQRLGIFAGSGVGKTTLLAMLARHARADALVLGLIGERGTEVRSFLDEGLGAAGRARSVVVVATSDLPAMLRRRAALVTLTVAEALRDRGMRVLCLIDSVTRIAMALREIHLAAGEPPTSKGYPPGVFAELPRLLERAGPGEAAGSITGLFTVLVEGDDPNDPVADAVRAILDGHVVLDRAVAEGGRFPALDVLRSLSRSAPGAYGPDEAPLAARARQLIKAYADMAELIQLGAYRAGGDPLIDEAIRVRPALEALLAQAPDEASSLEADRARLAEIVGRAASGEG